MSAGAYTHSQLAINDIVSDIDHDTTHTAANSDKGIVIATPTQHAQTVSLHPTRYNILSTRRILRLQNTKTLLLCFNFR